MIRLSVGEMQTLQVAHFLLLPGDDAASTAREPNSALSDTRPEPRIHEGPLHCPALISSVPATKTLSLNSTLAFGSAHSREILSREQTNFVFKRNTQFHSCFAQSKLG